MSLKQVKHMSKSTPSTVQKADNVAFRRGRHTIRDEYEQHFSGIDSREVTVHRVVNIVEKRNPVPRQGFEFERSFSEDQWYEGPGYYPNDREYHEDGGYPPNDRRYFDENPNFGNFRRNSPPPRNDSSYYHQNYTRDDLRHQIGSRKNGRSRPYFRNKGRGSGPPQREDRGMKRDRSPVRRDAHHPPARSGSNTSNRSFSPDRDKSYNQRHKPSAAISSHTPGSNTSSSSTSNSITPSGSAEEPQHSSAPSKEKTPASAAETEEVVVAASVEPKPTPDEDFKARRSEAIKAKALEIEKDYRQDCETFRTVVKMLVTKEPSLENLLQVSLDKNLLELKERCLDTLKHFVMELDEVLEQTDTTSEATGNNTQSL